MKHAPHNCSCCTSTACAAAHADGTGLNRRQFLATAGATLGSFMLAPGLLATAEEAARLTQRKRGATVRAAFLYTPSKTMAENPDGWWSWPGNDYDAEGRQKQYTAALREMEKKLDMKLIVEEQPLAGEKDALAFTRSLGTDKPDGVLLIMLHNRSLGLADQILTAAGKDGIPAVFYIGLGVKHGPVGQYRRPGVYFIQSLDNMNAIEYGLRMINTRKHLAQSRILSVTDVEEPGETVDKFLGVTTRIIPFQRYADAFEKVEISDEIRRLLGDITGKAREVRVTRESLDNAMRAHFALTRLIRDENADAVMMTCLKRGMLKPCLSFALLNNMLVPATCENDAAAVHGQLLGQRLVGRPGLQHNPAYETEANRYYASHCTCPTRLHGPDGAEAPYLLRRFAHSNEGSTAIQVFWKEGDPVTMLHYYAGSKPALDVYSGRVFKSHDMPPAGGCTTNVEIEITDRPDACMVRGHHNLLFCGDFANKFKHFARLYRMELKADTRAAAQDPV